MKYICDVSGQPIPEGKNVTLHTSPKKESNNISDFSKEREHLSQEFMVNEEIVTELIKLIKSGELFTILNVWPPDNNGNIKSLKTPLYYKKIDDPNDHMNHRFPVGDCVSCEVEQYDDVTADDFDENGEMILHEEEKWFKKTNTVFM